MVNDYSKEDVICLLFIYYIYAIVFYRLQVLRCTVFGGAVVMRKRCASLEACLRASTQAHLEFVNSAECRSIPCGTCPLTLALLVCFVFTHYMWEPLKHPFLHLCHYISFQAARLSYRLFRNLFVRVTQAIFLKFHFVCLNRYTI